MHLLCEFKPSSDCLLLILVVCLGLAKLNCVIKGHCMLVLFASILDQVSDSLTIHEGGIMYKRIGVSQVCLRHDDVSMLLEVVNLCRPDSKRCNAHERRIATGIEVLVLGGQLCTQRGGALLLQRHQCVVNGLFKVKGIRQNPLFEPACNMVNIQRSGRHLD